MDRASQRPFAWSAFTPERSSRVPSRPICRSSSRLGSSWSSISRPRRRSASPCRRRSLPAPTRSSNEAPRFRRTARRNRGVAAAGTRATEGDAGDRLSQPCLAVRFGPFTAAFRRGLSEAGYVEGENLAIEYRWAENNYERLPSLAADLVDRKVDLIGTTDVVSSLAAKNA